MRKKRIAVAAALCFVLAAQSVSAKEISDEYVTISEYDGVEITEVRKPQPVTDEDVDDNIQMILEGYAKVTEITDRPAKKGDIVVLDYTASAEGEVLEGGDVTDARLVLGEESLYKGFDKSVIGHEVGDVFETKHKFTKDDGSQSLVGHEVTLEVTLKSIRVAELPELSDDFVKTVSKKSSTVKEYREEVRELMEEVNEENYRTGIEDSAWTAVLQNTEVKEYPQEDVQEQKDAFYAHYQALAAAYDVEFSELLQTMGVTEGTFAVQALAAAQEDVKENLAVSLIASEEGITLSDEEFAAAKEDLVKELSYENVEQMEENVPEESLRKYVLRDKVKAWVAEHCVQVELQGKE